MKDRYDIKNLQDIMKSELKNNWKLDIKFDWKVGWEGEAFGDGKTIMLYFSGKDYPGQFGAFLHELAHAIDIEQRPKQYCWNPHDFHWADIYTNLVMKYMANRLNQKSQARKDQGEEKNDSLALMQMYTAHEFSVGGGTNIDSFIRSQGLNTKYFLKLAKRENIPEDIIKVIKDNLVQENPQGDE